MKVLYVSTDPGIPFWGTKGASIHVRSFSRALAAAGHHVHVIVSRLGHPEGSLEPAITVTETPSAEESFFQPGPEACLDESTLLYEARQFSHNNVLMDVVNDVLASGDFDVICERYALFSYAGLECARWHSLPFVLEANAPLIQEARNHRHLVLSPLAEAIERFLFSHADRVIPVSDSLGEYIRSVAPDARLAVIPNGVDLQRFELATDSETWRTSWVGTDADPFVIGFVGSLKPWHGLDGLLESFRGIFHEDGQAHLVLVGGGPEQEKIEHLIDKHDLGTRVHLTGPIRHEDIPDALGAMDVLVAPYPDMNSFYFSPLKMYEYMAAGKPIVASAIGQIRDIVEHESTGLLVPPGNVKSLTESILRVRRDPELADRLGERAREVAFDSHGWNRRIEVWESEVAQAAAVTQSAGVAL